MSASKGPLRASRFDETGSRIFVKCRAPGNCRARYPAATSNSTLETAGAISNFGNGCRPPDDIAVVVFRSPAKLMVFARRPANWKGISTLAAMPMMYSSMRGDVAYFVFFVSFLFSFFFFATYLRRSLIDSLLKRAADTSEPLSFRSRVARTSLFVPANDWQPPPPSISACGDRFRAGGDHGCSGSTHEAQHRMPGSFFSYPGHCLGCAIALA